MITVRRSLAELVNKGLIKKRHGEGSFVANCRPVQHAHAEKLLGFVIPSSSGYHNGDMVEAVETTVRGLGFSLIVKHSQNDPKQETACVQMLLQRGVSGLIIAPVTGEAADRETLLTCARLIADDVPFVMVDRYLPVLNCNYVTTDNRAGAYNATRHLIELGHRRIAMIRSLPCSSVDARVAGYLQALEEAGLEADARLALRVENEEASIREGIERLLFQTDGDFTALFCSNDGIAQVVYSVFRERGIRMPDDVAVVGYDDAPFAAFLNPPLTTVRQPTRQVGEAAARLLVESLEIARGRASPVQADHFGTRIDRSRVDDRQRRFCRNRAI